MAESHPDQLGREQGGQKPEAGISEPSAWPDRCEDHNMVISKLTLPLLLSQTQGK